MRKKRFRWQGAWPGGGKGLSLKIKRAGLLTKIVIAALLLYAVITLIGGRAREAKAEATRDRLASQVASLTEENAGMQYDIDHSTDPSVIEGIARNKLGLVKPGEKIFYDVGN